MVREYSLTMIVATASETISCTPDEMLEFVMDIERYQEVDTKIRPITWSRRTGNLTEFTCRPKLGGLRIPGPQPLQHVRLTPGTRVEISLAPSVWTKLASFNASFECTPVNGGTRVDRRLTFTFSPALRWFFEPFLRRRLPAEVRDELRRAKHHLENLATQP